MKLNTEIHWSFTNSGCPEDNESGSGNYVDLAKATAKWMSRVTMNNGIRIDVRRKPIASNHDSAMKDLDAELDSMLMEGIN